MPARATHIEHAHAKINLCLAVQYPPQNGYHKLDSVFQEISLSDVLHFDFAKCGCADNNAWTGSIQTKSEKEKIAAKTQSESLCWQHGTTKLGSHIALSCSSVDIPIENNLIFKAINLLEEAHGLTICDDTKDLQIKVEKNIPAGGGLGGGSSDAAACIRAFSHFNNIDLLCDANIEVAHKLGADVAFFLHGGCALMSGRGDILVRKLPSFPLKIVLMGSNESCSTGEVYARFDKNPMPAPDTEELAESLESYEGSESQISKVIAGYFLADRCGNNLQDAAFQTLPILRERIVKARAHEYVLNALVTGSGATCYAICATTEHANEFARAAKEFCDWIKVVDAL